MDDATARPAREERQHAVHRALRGEFAGEPLDVSAEPRTRELLESYRKLRFGVGIRLEEMLARDAVSWFTRDHARVIERLLRAYRGKRIVLDEAGVVAFTIPDEP